MQQRLEQGPGIERATYSLYSPMEGNNWSNGVSISGRPSDPERTDSTSWNRVGPGYFETMGTRVLIGRSITAADTPASQRVAVVNTAFATKFLAGRNPLDAQLGIGDASHSGDFQVVGVVEDVKYTGADRPTRPMVFFPVMQVAQYSLPADRQVQARSTLVRAIELKVAFGRLNLEPAIRRALAEVHPDLTVTRIVAMEDQIRGNFRTNRLLAALAGAYGGLALLLASLGLYGVTSYGVSRRLHEIGVRMALGADRGRIIRSVLRSALMQTSLGLAIGVPLAMAASGALATQLFDVNARDPIVLGLAAAALVVTAALAATLPARRAASVDPARALRTQ
jgi:predicted permease